jgi:hypothetical protein
MMKPRPGHKDAPDDDDDVEPGSAVRAKRHRLDPRLEAIAEQARQGRLTEQEALDQIAQVLGEWAGRALPPTAQLGVETALRELARDPKVLAILREDDE